MHHEKLVVLAITCLNCRAALPQEVESHKPMEDGAIIY